MGFQEAGFVCAAAFDHDKYAIETHKQNFGTPSYCVDLAHPTGELIDLIRRNDILIAGPPCQGFSTAGNNDPHDKRNDHLANVAKIATLGKPKIVVIENVQGLLSKHNSRHFQNLMGTLSEAGYTVTWKLLNAYDYGVPQTRRRIVVVASLTEPFQFNLGTYEHASLRDALHDVDSHPDHREALLPAGSDLYWIAQRIKPGQKLSNVRRSAASVHTWQIPEVYGFVSEEEAEVLNLIVRLRRQQRRRPNGDADPVSVQVLTSAIGSTSSSVLQSLIAKGYLKVTGEFVDLRNTFNGKFRRLSWELPSPTVDTRFGQPRYFLHPDRHRGFSAREAARIQTFPDSFKFSGGETAAFRMIGNAVPPRFSAAIAASIRTHLGET